MKMPVWLAISLIITFTIQGYGFGKRHRSLYVYKTVYREHLRDSMTHKDIEKYEVLESIEKYVNGKRVEE